MNAFVRLVSLPGVSHRLAQKYQIEDRRLAVTLLGLNFVNPVGLAAGFDKAGQWYNELGQLGFGHIEIGTVTGQAQPGNPKPRLFRLPRDKALINRMGFNSDGCQAVAESLQHSIGRRQNNLIVGINIGKSKAIPLDEAPAEHQKSFEALFPFADYFTINLSSPNTPNLRELQNREHLVSIVRRLNLSNEQMARQSAVARKPVLLKIAPDLNDELLSQIVGVASEFNIDGIIATNTTISRSGLRTGAATINRIGNGGLSGRPLTTRSRQIVAKLYRQLNGKIPIIGVGGIMNGADAWKMISAGAGLIQLYTGFVYGGPAIVREINLELLRQLELRGIENISDAVGISAGEYSESAGA